MKTFEDCVTYCRDKLNSIDRVIYVNEIMLKALESSFIRVFLMEFLTKDEVCDFLKNEVELGEYVHCFDNLNCYSTIIYNLAEKVKKGLK